MKILTLFTSQCYTIYSFWCSIKKISINVWEWYLVPLLLEGHNSSWTLKDNWLSSLCTSRILSMLKDLTPFNPCILEAVNPGTQKTVKCLNFWKRTSSLKPAPSSPGSHQIPVEGFCGMILRKEKSCTSVRFYFLIGWSI